jgi:hypothetical protein
MFYLLILRVRLPPRLYSGNKKAGKRRSAPFTFWIDQLSPCLPTKFEFGFRCLSRVAVHNVGTFQASTTWSSAQGGIGELVLMPDLTTELATTQTGKSDEGFKAVMALREW